MFIYMYTYIYMHIYTHTYTSINIYTDTYIYTYLYTNINTQIYIYLYIHITLLTSTDRYGCLRASVADTRSAGLYTNKCLKIDINKYICIYYTCIIHVFLYSMNV